MLRNGFSVSDFAKKTGDYRHLSATDISVLALTYMLEKQHVGADHINTEPVKKVLILFVFRKWGVSFFFYLKIWMLNLGILKAGGYNDLDVHVLVTAGVFF